MPTAYRKQPGGSVGSLSPWLSVPPLCSFPIPRLVPCKGPSATWDIFFYLEENPTSLRPRRVSEVGQTRRGSSGFSVPRLLPLSPPLAPLDLPYRVPGSALQSRPCFPGPASPLAWTLQRPFQPGTLPFRWDSSPTSGHHLINLLPGLLGGPKVFGVPQVQGGEVPVSGLVASQWES